MAFPIPSFSDARKAVTSFATGTATGCELISGLAMVLSAVIAKKLSKDAGGLVFNWGVPCGVFGGLAYSSLRNSFDKYTLAATAVAVTYEAYNFFNKQKKSALIQAKKTPVDIAKESFLSASGYSFVAAVVSEGIQYAAACYSASRS